MVEKIKKLKAKQSGFTIVELLIVIVVIGILAAITIVAYSGITARANAVKAQTNAANTQKVAEAMNADNGYYPATLASFTSGSLSTKEPTGITVVADAATTPINNSNGLTTVAYACLTTCPNSTGGRITWWNFAATPSPTVNYVYVGSASNTTPTASFVYPSP